MNENCTNCKHCATMGIEYDCHNELKEARGPHLPMTPSYARWQVCKHYKQGKPRSMSYVTVQVTRYRWRFTDEIEAEVTQKDTIDDADGVRNGHNAD